MCFDYMLDLRALNDGVDMRREQMFADYNDLRREKFQMHGMKDYDPAQAGKRRAGDTANPRWHAARCPPMCAPAPNGESALAVFSERIRENALISTGRAGKQSFTRAAAGACTVFA